MSVDQRQRVVYVASKDLVKVSSLLPSNENRSNLVHTLISALGLLKDTTSSPRKIQVVNPTRATRQALLSYHSRDYVDFILGLSGREGHDREELVEFGLEDDCPLFRGVSEYVPLVAGAVLTAVETVKTGFAEVAICWDGGRHHARKSKATGFCYVADCTLAILSLKRPTPMLPKPRVMYLDLDLHFSDGVSEAFYSPTSSNSQILTMSIHHASPGFFPVSPLTSLPSLVSDTFDPFTLSIPLHRGASNRTYARIWPIIERVQQIFKPDYVVLQCGVDALAGDPYGILNWGLGPDEGSLGWCVRKVIEEWNGKKVLLGGGGYNSPNVARAWAYLTSIAIGTPLDLDTEVPDHSHFPQYAPSFTLDVAPGNMQDGNSDEYLSSIEDTYHAVISVLEDRVKPLYNQVEL